MTDLEMTKLCAKAMGLNVQEFQWEKGLWIMHANGSRTEYDPRHIDKQAMALMKGFRLHGGWYEDAVGGSGRWSVYYSYGIWADSDESFNYAIVECVARMQQRRT